MKVKALKFTKNDEFHGNTEMGVFHGRSVSVKRCLPRSPGQPQHHKYQNRIWWRPISRKMSRLWNHEIRLDRNGDLLADSPGNLSVVCALQIEWLMAGECTTNSRQMPGFYVKKKHVRWQFLLPITVTFPLNS